MAPISKKYYSLLSNHYSSTKTKNIRSPFLHQEQQYKLLGNFFSKNWKHGEAYTVLAVDNVTWYK